MNPDEDHRMDEISDLLALGAAGALSDDEYRVLEERLAADPLLATEYHELQASASVLAEATSEAPPPSLRAAVLDAVKNVEQLPPASAPPHPVAPSNVVSIHHRRWMIPATAAAAVVMLLITGLLINRFADAPSDDRMSAVLNADDATTIELSGSLAGLQVVSSADENAAVLMGAGVAQPEPGLVFQLWAIHDDEMVGMATFRPAVTGVVAMVIDDDGSDAQWAVTIEPEGGSAQPTSDPVAASPPA